MFWPKKENVCDGISHVILTMENFIIIRTWPGVPKKINPFKFGLALRVTEQQFWPPRALSLSAEH